MEDTHVEVILEEVRSQFKAFGEGLQGVRAEIQVLREDVADLGTELFHQTTVLGGKIDGVAKDVAVLKTDVAVLKTDVAGLKMDVAVLKTDMAEVKVRVTGVETRLNGAPPPRPVRKRR